MTISKDGTTESPLSKLADDEIRINPAAGALKRRVP